MRKFFADVSADLPIILNEVSVLYTTCCGAFPARGQRAYRDFLAPGRATGKSSKGFY